MKEAIIATHNQGKVKEFKEILEPKGYSVSSLAEIGFTEEIEETGHTFEENAILKAEAVAKAVNKMVIADDSGLSVDNLGGRPGVYSARYAGEAKDDKANMDKVLSELKASKKSDARPVSSAPLPSACRGRKQKRSKVMLKGILRKDPREITGSAMIPFLL